MYIHERDNWTSFKWDASVLTSILEEVGRKQGLAVWQAFLVGF